jgi:hypothetical protein
MRVRVVSILVAFCAPMSGCFFQPDAQEDPASRQPVAVISCTETAPVTAGGQPIFCVEQWGQTRAQADANNASCVAEQSDGGVFTATQGPCPLDGAVGGCLEARDGVTPFVQWWYSDNGTATPDSVQKQCDGNPFVVPP